MLAVSSSLVSGSVSTDRGVVVVLGCESFSALIRIGVFEFSLFTMLSTLMIALIGVTTDRSDTVVIVGGSVLLSFGGFITGVITDRLGTCDCDICLLSSFRGGNTRSGRVSSSFDSVTVTLSVLLVITDQNGSKFSVPSKSFSLPVLTGVCRVVIIEDCLAIAGGDISTQSCVVVGVGVEGMSVGISFGVVTDREGSVVRVFGMDEVPAITAFLGDVGCTFRSVE